MSAFGILGYGVSGVPGERQVDPLPLLGILAALAITRWVIGARLTPMNGVFAALAGASWSFAVESSGPLLPTFVACGLILVLRVIHHRQDDLLRAEGTGAPARPQLLVDDSASTKPTNAIASRSSNGTAIGNAAIIPLTMEPDIVSTDRRHLRFLLDHAAVNLWTASMSPAPASRGERSRSNHSSPSTTGVFHAMRERCRPSGPRKATTSSASIVGPSPGIVAESWR